MPIPRFRTVVAAAALLSTATCSHYTPAEYLERNPSAREIHVRCRAPDVAAHVDVWARQIASGQIVTNEDDMELRLFMPYADVLFVLDPAAPDPSADDAAEMYWSCPEIERFLASPEVLFREQPCSSNVAQSNARPDPHWVAEPGPDKPPCDTPGTTSPSKGPVTIRVCVRPPGAPDTMMRWAAIRGAKDPQWKLPQSKFDQESADAVVFFEYDASAPPETAYYFNKSAPKLRCPGKDPKPLKDVLGDGSMPLLGEFVSDEGNGTSPGKTGSITTTTTTGAPKKGDGTTSASSSPDGKGPRLTFLEEVTRQMAIAAKLASGDTSGSLKDPNGHRNGMPGSKNVGGFSFAPLQAGMALTEIVSSVFLTPERLIKKVAAAAGIGKRVVINEVNGSTLNLADKLIKDHGEYVMAESLRLAEVILPFKMGQKFTATLGSKFQAHKIFEKRAIELLNTEGEKALKEAIEKAPSIILTHEEHTKISNALNAAWKAQRAKVERDLTKADLREIYEKVYKTDYPHWLEAIESYLR